MTSQAVNQIVTTIGQNVLRARLDAGLTQRELGVGLGIDSRGVSRWENGKVAPSRKNLARLADLLGRDIAWFYAEHDEKDAA